MRIDVLTLFPEIFESPLRASLLGKALDGGILEVVVSDIRDFATDRHRTVDDAPYGGGPGMVMRCEPVFAAVESLQDVNSLERVVLLSARGKPMTQTWIRNLAGEKDAVLICGRYEGIDERVGEALCTDEISVGDYVLSGGELPALTVIEAVSRMLPGVVGNFESVETDSYYDGILGPPQYTRPQTFRNMTVPETLRNGDHAAIRRWRRAEALLATESRRGDLLVNCSTEDRQLLEDIRREKSGAPKNDSK